MLPAEITGTQIPIPTNFGMIQTNTPDFYFNRFLANLANSPNSPNSHFPTPQYCSISNNSSTSDEAEEHQLSIIDERKQRRMISNRESARRSRMRKQLNHVTECHDRVLQENARLKEEASDLRQMLTDLQIGSPYDTTTFRDLEEVDVPCNAAHLRAESSSQSISNSVDLLH